MKLKSGNAVLGQAYGMAAQAERRNKEAVGGDKLQAMTCLKRIMD